MKVLVTGGTGFLGQLLVNKLVEYGHQVRISVRKQTSAESLRHLPIEIVEGDVTDAESMLRASQNVDVVFHLAGLIAYSKSQRRQMDLVNIGGTKNVVDACEKNQIPKLIHLSSVVAVGASFEPNALNEEAAYNIAHLNLGYFETKHAAELIVKNATDAGRIRSVMINPSTIYGPGDAEKGSRKVQVKVAQGRFMFYPPGGVNVVDADDVVDAIVTAPSKGRNGERYILAGENLYIKELFKIIADTAGQRPPWIPLSKNILFALGHIGDWLERHGKSGPLTTENAWTSCLFHWFDSTKAQTELGFKSKPAAVSIEKSVRWMRDHGLLDQ